MSPRLSYTAASLLEAHPLFDETVAHGSIVKQSESSCFLEGYLDRDCGWRAKIILVQKMEVFFLKDVVLSQAHVCFLASCGY